MYFHLSIDWPTVTFFMLGVLVGAIIGVLRMWHFFNHQPARTLRTLDRASWVIAALRVLDKEP